MNNLEKQILVVDDDAAIRALLRTVLQRRGFRVDLARNGVEALDLLVSRQYALVLLDVMMPRMNGYELIDHLTRHPIDPPPRVLLLTAGHEPRAKERGLVIGTVHKPFEVASLLDVVMACVSGVFRPSETATTAVAAEVPVLN